VEISRISHAAVDMGAEAAARLRVRDSESGSAGVGDGLFYSASEGVQGLHTEQQTPRRAPLHATNRVLMVADEPAYEVRASAIGSTTIQERTQQVERNDEERAGDPAVQIQQCPHGSPRITS